MNKEIEGKNQKGLFQVGKFRFENEKIEAWVDINLGGNMDYDYKTEKTGITPLNPNEALLSFEFKLELLPNTGKITFSGDCLLISPRVKILIMILKAKKDSVIRNKNQAFMIALNKLLARRCLDHAKIIGEKEGVHFHNYEDALHQFGLDKISFNNPEKKILSLKGDSLVPKQQKRIKILAAGFKEFIYYNEKVIPGVNIGLNIQDAHFEVNSKTIKPKILSKKRLLIQYHFTMKISPKIGLIEFDGQFVMDSFKNEVGYLLKNEKEKLTKALRNVIAKEGIKHSEKLGQKYRIGFSAEIVLKKLGIK